jgi:hypothetical protein
MANKNTISIELVVDDKGTVVIKQFGQSTEQTLRRAESASSQAADSMSSHWRSVATTLGGVYTAYKVADFAKDSALMAARYETLGVVMGVVGNNAGYTYAQMDQFSRSLQANGISMIESRQSLTRMAQAQLDLTKSSELARVAQDAAVIGNINSSEAFERMIVGIQTGQTEILRTIGINVNFEESYKKLAKQLGRSVESLTEAEKAAARMGATMDAGKRIAGTYEAAMMTAGKQLTSFARYVDDYKVLMGQAFGPATSILVSGATDAMKRMQEEIAKPDAQKALRDLSVEMAKVITQLGEGLPGAIGKTTSAISGLTKIYNALPSEIVGGAGVGILGRILFGSTPVARALAAAYMAASVLEKVGKSQEMDFVGTVTTVAKTMIAAPFMEKPEHSPAWYSSLALDEFSTPGISQAHQDNIKAIEDARKRTEEAAKAATEANAKATQSVVEATRKAAYEIDAIGLGQYDKDIARINAKADKYTKAGADKVKVAEFVSVETAVAKAKEDQRVKEYEDKAWERFRDLRAKEAQEAAKGAEEYRQIVAAEYEFGTTEHEQAVNAIRAKEQEKFEKLDDLYFRGYISYAEYEDARARISANTKAKILAANEKTSIERLKVERDLYTDIRGYEQDYYDASVKLLQDQAEQYRKQGVAKNAVDVWLTEEMAKLDLRRLKNSKNFVDGVNAGFMEMQRNAMTFGKAGYDIFKTFSTSSQAAMSTILFDSIKKGSFDAGAVWETFTDSMLKRFTDTMSQMVFEAAAHDVAMMFKASWTQDSSAILGLINKGWDLLSGMGGSGEGQLINDTGLGNLDPSLMVASGGRIDYRDGGKVAGIAPYPGDHPGNDKIPAWLSADEVVIRRGAVNPDTAEILDYINRFGQPPEYAFGGRVMNQVTDTPGRGYFGFGDIVSSLTGGFTDFVGLTNSSLPTLGAYLKAGNFSSVEELIARIADPSGIVRGGTRDLGARMPEWMIDIAQAAGPIIGMIWGPGGAAAGSDIASELAAGYYGGDVNEREHFIRAGMAAVLTYIAQGKSGAGWKAGSAEVGYTGATVSDTAMSAAKKYASNWALGEVAQTMFGTPGMRGSISFEGAYGDLSWLGDSMYRIAPKAEPFAFSARDGLDYVPYDGFLAELHKAERVQTAPEAEATRRGSRDGKLSGDRNIETILYQIAKNTQKAAHILSRFDDDGLPETRVLA